MCHAEFISASYILDPETSSEFYVYNNDQISDRGSANDFCHPVIYDLVQSVLALFAPY